MRSKYVHQINDLESKTNSLDKSIEQMNAEINTLKVNMEQLSKVLEETLAKLKTSVDKSNKSTKPKSTKPNHDLAKKVAKKTTKPKG